jgi:hypothetical protein
MLLVLRLTAKNVYQRYDVTIPGNCDHVLLSSCDNLQGPDSEPYGPE